MNEGIRKLPTEFIGRGEVRGQLFRQLLRGEQSTLYEVNDNEAIHYDVFRIRISKYPRTRELYETYPKRSSFGIRAWVYRNFEKAIVKYNEIDKV